MILIALLPLVFGAYPYVEMNKTLTDFVTEQGIPTVIVGKGLNITYITGGVGTDTNATSICYSNPAVLLGNGTCMLVSQISGTGDFSFTDFQASYDLNLSNIFNQHLNTTNNVVFNSLNVSQNANLSGILYTNTTNVGIGMINPTALFQIASIVHRPINISGAIWVNVSEDAFGNQDLRVGIKTSQPCDVCALDVHGVVRSDDACIMEVGGSSNKLHVSAGKGGSFSLQNTSGTETAHFRGYAVYGTQAYMLRGGLGIGIQTATQLLDVRGAGNFSSTIWINNGTDVSTLGGAGQNFNETFAQSFKNNFTESFTLNATGLGNFSFTDFQSSFTLNTSSLTIGNFSATDFQGAFDANASEKDYGDFNFTDFQASYDLNKSNIFDQLLNTTSAPTFAGANFSSEVNVSDYMNVLGINVGSATGAGAGEINMSGDLYVLSNDIYFGAGLTADPTLHFQWEQSGNILTETLMFDKYLSGYGDGRTFEFSDDAAVEGDFYTTGGINVGSATGAGAGEIKLSDDLEVADDAYIKSGLNLGSRTGAPTGYIYTDAGTFFEFKGDDASNVGVIEFEDSGDSFRWLWIARSSDYAGANEVQFMSHDGNWATHMVIYPDASGGHVGFPQGINVGGTADPGDDNLQVDGKATITDYVAASGGVHVGGTSDPGTDTLVVDGTIKTAGLIEGTASSIGWNVYASLGNTCLADCNTHGQACVMGFDESEPNIENCTVDMTISADRCLCTA